MERDSFSLDDLLDEDELLQEVKQENDKLIDLCVDCRRIIYCCVLEFNIYCCDWQRALEFNKPDDTRWSDPACSFVDAVYSLPP